MSAENPATPTPDPGRTVIRKLVLRAVAIIAVIILINLAFGMPVRMFVAEIGPNGLAGLGWGIVAICVVYGLVLAVPFVPGVEIGMALLIIVGPDVAPHVYMATVGGLCLGYGIGRLIPLAALKRLAGMVGAHPAEALVDRLMGQTRAERASTLMASAPTGVFPVLLRNRYLALAVLLNLPGNALIGGGGGIAMLAGCSRLFSAPAFFLAAALAVAPFPLAVYLFGIPDFMLTGGG